MAQTRGGKKKVYVEGYTYKRNGKVVTVKTHYLSTPN